MLNGAAAGICKFSCNLPKARINSQRSAKQKGLRTHFKFTFREQVERVWSYVIDILEANQRLARPWTSGGEEALNKSQLKALQIAKKRLLRLGFRLVKLRCITHTQIDVLLCPDSLIDHF